MNRIILSLFLAPVLLFGQTPKLDSLKKVLLTAKEDTDKVNVLNGLSALLRYSGDKNQLLYAKDALGLSQKLKFTKGEGDSYLRIGWVYADQSKYADALKNYYLSLKAYETANKKAGISVALQMIGVSHLVQGNTDDALKILKQGLQVREEIGDTFGLAQSYNSIGGIYLQQNNYTDALSYFNNALRIYLKPGAPVWGETWCYMNIGNAYERRGDSALNADNKPASENFYGMALKEFTRALEIRSTANYAMGNGANSIRGIMEANLSIGGIYMKTKNYPLAKKYVQEGFRLSFSTGEKTDIMQSYLLLSDLDSLQGNYRKAFADYKMYVTYRDSLYNDENSRKAISYKFQYETEKAEETAKAEQEKKDTVTKIIIYSISGGLLLVILLSGFIFRSYKQKQKANIIITEQKEEVERQKMMVEQKQKEMLDSIHYAKRIQQSLLPTEKYIDKSLKRLQKK